MGKLPLVGPQHTPFSLAADAQQTTNLIVEANSAPGKSGGALYGTPGRHLFISETYRTAAVWGGGGRCFIISGNAGGGLDLVELSKLGAEITRHNFTGTDNGKPGNIVSNGNELMVVANNNAYIDDGSGPVLARFTLQINDLKIDAVFNSQVTSASEPFDSGDVGYTLQITGGSGFTIGNYTISSVTLGVAQLSGAAGTVGSTGGIAVLHMDAVTAVTGAYLDGYFIVQRPSGGTPDLGRQFNISLPLNGDFWDPLDFASKEAWPDYIRQVLVDSEQLYLFGHETFEVWQNNPGAGLGGFPFARVPGAMARYGSISSWGNVAMDGTVFMLTTDDRGGLAGYMLRGFTPERVSDAATEFQWNSSGQVVASNAVSYCYLENGHLFWVINLGSNGGSGVPSCWHFDPAQPPGERWATRAAWDGSLFQQYPTCFHTFIPEFDHVLAAGAHITAGNVSGDGSIYQSSVLFFDDNGKDIRWVRALPYVYDQNRRLYFNRLELEMETGAVFGLAVTAATNASPTHLTITPATQLQTGNTITLAGGTGNWAAINGTWVVTVVDTTHITIPLNTTSFGALTGTILQIYSIIRDVSDDRGQIFTNPLTASAGSAGLYAQRVRWNRNGSARGRVFRLSGIGRTKVALVDLDCDMFTGAI